MPIKRIIVYACGHEALHEFDTEEWAKHRAEVMIQFDCRECRKDKRFISMPE